MSSKTTDDDKDEVQQNLHCHKFTKTAVRKRSKIFSIRQHRIIVRNLSYKVTWAKLHEEFERCGTVDEVNILKRPDGKLVGCAFVQYRNHEDSDRAVREMDGEMFMGRKMEVSYAVDKSAYQKVKSEKEFKEEKIKDEDVEVKEETPQENEKSEEDEYDEEDEDDEDNEDDEENEDDDGENEFDEDMEDMDEKEEKPHLDKLSKVKRDKNQSEIEEGRTVFVKNVPYDVEAEELKEVMSQFGIVEQVLINKERVSGHSKGTAFVIFKLQDSAQLSCRQSLKLQVQDQFVEILPALRKKDIMDREKEKKERRSKDSRNLYLLKEGLIMAGSPAAKDVSKTDMATRLRLEQRNNEVLKNYNRFVSRERLTIHNLPAHFTNNELRKAITDHTSHKPVECRVMRDSRPSFGNPLGKSRGYGFISFKRHEIALEVLRKLNNNPSVFGKNHRPIVSFSIEDLKVHNIKKQRMEKSRMNNPTYQKKLEELKKKKQQKNANKKAAKRLELEQLAVAPSSMLHKITARGNVPEVLGKKKKERKRDIEQKLTPFTGEIAKKGKVSLRSNRKIRHQADAHMQRIKEERKQQKKKRTTEEHAKNRQQKGKSQNKKPKLNQQELKKEDSYFQETVGKYKEMISHITKQPRGKWFSG